MVNKKKMPSKEKISAIEKVMFPISYSSRFKQPFSRNATDNKTNPDDSFEEENDFKVIFFL